MVASPFLTVFVIKPDLGIGSLLTTSNTSCSASRRPSSVIISEELSLGDHKYVRIIAKNGMLVIQRDLKCKLLRLGMSGGNVVHIGQSKNMRMPGGGVPNHLLSSKRSNDLMQFAGIKCFKTVDRTGSYESEIWYKVEDASEPVANFSYAVGKP